MARRSDHSKDELREMSITAAEAIVEAEGITGLSARKVAKQIGYTVGTLYFVFKNLDELILHVNARTLDMLHTQMLEATTRCRQPKTCIISIGRAYVLFATQHPQRWNMIFEHKLAPGELVPDWFAHKVTQMFELVEQQLAPLLEKQKRRKLDQVSRTLWCGVHGICSLAVNDKLEVTDAESIQQLTDTLITYFLTGLELDIRGETL